MVIDNGVVINILSVLGVLELLLRAKISLTKSKKSYFVNISIIPYEPAKRKERAIFLGEELG
jgi:hypothetical protein